MDLRIIFELFWKTILENYFQVCKRALKNILKIENRNSFQKYFENIKYK